MSDNNLTLWESVATTDPEHTKKVSQRGGYTAVSPQYQLKEATKVFGPYGMGFGFESCDLDLSQLETLGVVIVRAVFFYVKEDKRYTFPVNNAWPVKQGSRVDPDFAKKAETNTMSKALSKLGFSADIFLGQFDDVEYVNMVTSEKAIEKAEDKIAEEEKHAAEYREKCKKELGFISTASNMNELEKLYKDFIRRAGIRSDKDHTLAIKEATNKRKAELEPNNETTV